MNLKNNNEYGMRMGSFKDPKIENEFMEAQNNTLKRLMFYGMFIFGLFFLIFLIPDYLFNQTLNIKIKMTILRITVFAVILIAIFTISKLKNWKYIYIVITFCELMVSLIYFIISAQYETPNFMLQLLSLILVLLIFFIFPNRLINCIIMSILTWIIFIVIAPTRFSSILDSEYLSGFIFPILFIIAFIYWHVRLQSERRLQFIKNQQLIHLLHHDALTNIYNRYKFEVVLNTFLSMDHCVPMTLTLLDIDMFKQVNDNHGHLFGDHVLIFLADLIASHLGPKDLFARWGGEEFVILHYNSSVKESVHKVMKIKTALEINPVADHGCITCSYGITQIYPQDTIDELFNRADQLMYKAKANGRNQIMY